MRFQPVALVCFLWAAWLAVPVGAQDTAPSNLVISQPTGGLAESQLNLRWDPVPGALGYEVLRKRNGKWWLNEDDPNCIPMTNSTSITGLSPDTPVEFCVRAVLPKGLSATGPAVTARTIPLGTAQIVRPEAPTKPLPVVDEPTRSPRESVPSVPSSVKHANPDTDPLPITGSITDLVPSPPKPKAPSKEAPQSKGPPPTAPEGLMGLFSGGGDIRLSWRVVRDATGYLVEEERDGQWVTVEDGVIQENRPSLIVKGRGAGPYLFRVRTVRYGQRSSASLPTKVER